MDSYVNYYYERFEELISLDSFEEPTTAIVKTTRLAIEPIWQRPDEFSALIGCGRGGEFRDRLAAVFERAYSRFVYTYQDDEGNEVDFSEECAFMHHAFSHYFVAMLEHWDLTGRKQDPDELLHIALLINNLINGAGTLRLRDDR